MTQKLNKVIEIPTDVCENDIFEIDTNDVGYYTHSFFKYPCKFIPQIPRWAIKKYSDVNGLVLDCFSGSGTTLVESILHGRNALGVDFDKLSHLLSITKTTQLSKEEISFARLYLDKVLSKRVVERNKLPKLENLTHWFSEETINHLYSIKENIDLLQNPRVKNFYLVCFASLIKKVSRADSSSPKPYVSKRIPKKEYNVNELFKSTVNKYLKSFEKYSDTLLGQAEMISDDARFISNENYIGKVDLAITSPPYINAFDYVRSLRLENVWLNNFSDEDMQSIKLRQIGTEQISVNEYKNEIKVFGIDLLDEILKKIFFVDKKRAHVVARYFDDMEKNIISVRKLLKLGAHYVIVVGDSQIRKIDVPTHEILIKIAQRNGFKYVTKFSYIIKNRYLRIPRSEKGGLIKYDWIIDISKE